VVFFHELGHAVAIILEGGHVVAIHYAFLSGYVIPAGNFTNEQELLYTLAGNAVQIAIGYIALTIAYFVASPPVVATLVYLGLWSIAGSAVFYALMSIVGAYGDWSAIYTSPDHAMVAVIAVCHAIVVASVVYMLEATKPRIWFAVKTRPEWKERYFNRQKLAHEQPTFDNLLNLAWAFFEANLYKPAVKTIEKSLELEPQSAKALYLLGWVYIMQLRLDRAQEALEAVTQSASATPQERARAFMGLATIWQNRSSRDVAYPIDKKTSQVQALEAYARAQAADPKLADPRFFSAVILNEMKRYSEAIKELEGLAGLNWLDDSQRKHVPEQMQIALKNPPVKQ
jgi:cytochrome c-type biogenesis protein CcmH/NrfG